MATRKLISFVLSEPVKYVLKFVKFGKSIKGFEAKPEFIHGNVVRVLLYAYVVQH